MLYYSEEHIKALDDIDLLIRYSANFREDFTSKLQASPCFWILRLCFTSMAITLSYETYSCISRSKTPRRKTIYAFDFVTSAEISSVQCTQETAVPYFKGKLVFQ